MDRTSSDALEHYFQHAARYEICQDVRSWGEALRLRFKPSPGGIASVTEISCLANLASSIVYVLQRTLEGKELTSRFI